MDVSFEQGFLTDIGRIDEKVVIESWEDLNGERRIPHVICQGKKMQVCLVNAPEGNENLILRFYYNGGKLGFMISERTGIYIEKHRTIFEFNLPFEPKAIIESKDLPEDTKILEGLGTELGCSLYKDISVSSDSLVWKESLGKYAVDRGLQDKHLYDVELLDTKSGQLEERPIRFKSYTGITVDQGNWEIETIKTTVLVKHDVYSEISDSTFLVWDSPMIDAKVDLEVEPVCINNIGKYLDPLNVVFGNTDCFQFTNYGSTLRGFRLTGTEGSKVAILFNKESSNGSYTEFECVIGSEGVAEVRIPEDLPYYHFNGIETRGPSRITKVETILNIEESVDQYTPNPDKTYLVRVKNENATIEINGYADYIEYEKYLGTITEIGRGKGSITDIPELSIEDIAYSGDLHYRVDKIGKQIEVYYNPYTGAEVRSVTLQLKIENNIEVNGNIITTTELNSDYKIKIEQDGFFWKLVTIPDYVNGDDNLNVYVTGSDESSYRSISIFTNYTAAQSITPIISEELSEVFNIITTTVQRGVKVDGVYGTIFNLAIYTKSRNRETTWRPKDSSGNPFKVGISHTQFSSTGLSFYLIQLREIKPKMEIWEETLPGKYTKIDSSLKIYNSMTKSFVVVEKVIEGSTIPEEDVNWYYYDLVGGQNKFYLTNYSGEVTNSGFVYFVSPNTTLLDLGTGVDRVKYGRLVNVNKSDLIDGLGTLTVTESSEYPGSWRNVVDNNTVNAEVERIVDNVYVQVGHRSSDLKNEDLEIEVDSISLYGFYIQCNFKYTVEAHGYLKIYSTSGVFVDEVEKFSGYSSKLNWRFGLFRLDEEPEMGKTYIEIRSANVVRKVTLKVVDPRNEHDYLYSIPPSGSAVDKPNLIRIFGNGATSPTSSNKFYYKSYTTPSFTSSGVNTFVENTTTYISNICYLYHETEIPLSISNSKSLGRSKYPIKSFGYIQESSLSYSDGETYIGDTSLSGPLKYQLYMRGKEHYLWCVDNLSGLSDLTDPSSSSSVITTKKPMILDASGGTSKTIYVVSRYSDSNQTFITESSKQTDYKITRNNLEVNIKILPQQNIGLNSVSQVEYAIPIQVSSNVENPGGNIFLGKVEFTAKTRITGDSISDIIDVSDDIIELEGIDSSYLAMYVASEKTQNLDVMIFQQGTNPDVLGFYSDIPDLGIEASVNYVIPEVGSNFKITSLNCVLSRNEYGPQGNDICQLTSQIYDDKYFLVEVTSKARIEDGEPHWYMYSLGESDYPIGIVQDTQYILNINIEYIYNGTSQTDAFYKQFKKYGCNYGLYVNGYIGFGVVDNYNQYESYNDVASIELPEEGGFLRINAGIFYAVDGLSTTEALIVPQEYEFIGENKPLEFKWENGNLDDGGNLYIKVPPRVRDDIGEKKYILKVNQPHKYYPISLYVVFYQRSMYDESGHPDTGKENYKLMFLKDSVNIYSNGNIEKGEDKFYFVHNLTESEFNKVTFEWDLRDGSTFPSFDNLNFLEEVERSYDEGYVKFNFKPNGNRFFIKAYIIAKYDGKEIGSIEVNQGYFCLISEYWNIKTKNTSWITDYTPVKNPFSRISPYSPTLYTYHQGHGNLSTRISNTPCKSNNDNSDSSYGYGRGVYKLTPYKKEYYDVTEVFCDVNNLFDNSEIVYISPKQALESYGLNFVNSGGSSTSDDPDAKINPRFNDGSNHVTSTNFGTYAPYIELSYLLKDEFIRDYITITASGKVTLKHPDTSEMVNFYLMFTTQSNMSDEPADPETFELSDYKLKFGYQGGTKQVSYHPESFDMNVSKLPATADWLSYSISEGSNIISVTVAENNTRTVDPTEEAASTRALTRSVVPELIEDPEGGGGGGIINPIDPNDNDNEHTLIDDGGGGGGGSSSGGDSSSDSSGSSSGDSSGSGGSSSSSGGDSSGSSSSSSSTNDGEEGETIYAFYRTAQIKIELVDDRNGLNYIMKTVYIDVEQDPDYTATGDGPQHVILDSSIRVKSDDENPVVIRLPENSALDVNVTNDPLPVSIDGTPTVNLASGTSVGISGQPISVTGTVEASNIPTDYARSSDIPSDIASSSDVISARNSVLGDINSAKNAIISAMPTCKYTPPSSGGDS